MLVVLAIVIVGVVGLMLMREPAQPRTDDNSYRTMDSDEDEDVILEEPELEDALMENKVLTIALAPVTTSAVTQAGTALITETADGLVVAITVTGYETEQPQPAHIHTGACPTVGEVVYPLENLVDGTSETTLTGVTLEQLESQLPLGINVHKSAEEASVYTSCGDVVFEE